MLTQEAIKLIQQSTAIESANAECPVRGIVALPTDFQVHDLEKHLGTRRRARGTFTTPFIHSFCTYTNAHAELGATVFVDPGKLGAKAVLNLGTHTDPGHTDNQAALDLVKTAPYLGLSLIANGSGRTQREVAEFLEDWQHLIECFDEAGVVKSHQAISAVRRITIESVRKLESEEQSLSATRSALESVTASSKEPIPTLIYFKCKPYAELLERTFVLRLGVLTGEKAPSITLRIVKPEEHAEAMCEELANLISEYLHTAAPIPVVIGTYQVKAN